MPRKLPPAPAKGTRHPGAGRAKGTPNRLTVEARLLCGQLVTNAAYQHKLRRDFERRKVHPAIETLVWSYHLGKPSQPVELSGGLALDVNARLEEEKRIFATLDIRDLEQLAAESQALVNRAVELAQIAGNKGPIPQDVVVDAKPESLPSESLGKPAESNNAYCVNQPIAPDSDAITPDDSDG